MASQLQGKVYRILSDLHPEVLPYYGSTINTLKERWGKHNRKGNNTSSKQIMVFDDARIELVEEVVCDSKEELLIREKWWIQNNPCCNKQTPIQSVEELRVYMKTYNKSYQETHKEEIKASQKAKWELHKEKYNATRRERYAKKKAG